MLTCQAGDCLSASRQPPSQTGASLGQQHSHSSGQWARGAQGYPVPILHQGGFNVTSNILGSSSTSVMQPHPGKCSLLSPWVLSRARLSKGVRMASETFQEGQSSLGAFCNTGGNDQADRGQIQRLPRLPLLLRASQAGSCCWPPQLQGEGWGWSLRVWFLECLV